MFSFEPESGRRVVKMSCNRCGEFKMEYSAVVMVDRDVLDGIHVLMYHPFAAFRLPHKFFYLNKLLCLSFQFVE